MAEGRVSQEFTDGSFQITWDETVGRTSQWVKQLWKKEALSCLQEDALEDFDHVAEVIASDEERLSQVSVEVDWTHITVDEDPYQEHDVGKFAFVSILFADKVAYCFDVEVLGESVRPSYTEYPFILVTKDVLVEWHRILEEIGWQLRKVDYIDGSHLHCAGTVGRFAGVSTKLHGVHLVEYDKIVLLDLDLLVRQHIDGLLDCPTPSAMRRHASATFVDGELIGGDNIVKRGRLISGISVGVMVMQPVEKELKQALDQIDKECPEEHENQERPSRISSLDSTKMSSITSP